MNRISHRTGLLLIVCLGIAFRLGMAMKGPVVLEGDAGEYHRIAANLAAGNGYSRDQAPPFEPTRYRTPTYPAFLAAVYSITGPSPRAAILVQCALGSLLSLVLHGIAAPLFGRRAGILAALLAAGYPALVFYDSRLLREGLCALLLACIVWTALNARGDRRYWGSGILMGVLTMCKPEMLALAPAVVLLSAGTPSRLRALGRPAIWMLACLLVFWAPWTIRSQILFGTPSPISRGVGAALWFGNRWADIGGDDQKPEIRAELRQRSMDIIESQQEATVDNHFFRLAARDLAERPFWMVDMVGRKVVMFWKDANGVDKTLPAIHPALAVAVNAGYYALLLLAVFAVVRRRNSVVVRRFGFLILSFVGVYALLHVRNRYRVPLLPVVWLLSAHGISLLTDLVLARYRRVASLDSNRLPSPDDSASANVNGATTQPAQERLHGIA